MPPRLPLTDEERRERKRLQDRNARVRRMENCGLKARGRPRAMDGDELRQRRRELNRASHARMLEEQKATGWMPYSRDPPPHVIEERDRVFAGDRRDLTATLLGDPLPGRRAIDHRESGT
jgi:hypothetical protein